MDFIYKIIEIYKINDTKNLIKRAKFLTNDKCTQDSLLTHKHSFVYIVKFKLHIYL